MKENRYYKPEVRSDLRFYYDTAVGRFLLKGLTRPGLSKVAGRFLDSRASRRLIPRFVKKNHIAVEEAEEREYSSFNDFFARRLKEGMRVIDLEPSTLISPCDSFLSVFPIEKEARFCINNSTYTVASLLQDEALAATFEGGYCAIFRLTVSDYHRYCYFDAGIKEENVVISGKLHTVNPIAGEKYRIYAENSREYTVLHTENFGDAVQMEVGALLVGKICNLHQKHAFRRGEEKGYFEYGGSTVILLLPPGRAEFDQTLLERSRAGFEKKVKMGEAVGSRAEGN